MHDSVLYSIDLYMYDVVIMNRPMYNGETYA